MNATVLLIVVGVVHSLRPVLGLSERGIYLGGLLWLALVLLPLLMES